MKSGIYVRKRIPNAMQDPTMQHVDDPQAFHVGDYVLLISGIHLITCIDNAVFGEDNTRFAHLVKVYGKRTKGKTMHNLRDQGRAR